MTHFNALVVGEDHEYELAKFNESDKNYFKFIAYASIEELQIEYDTRIYDLENEISFKDKYETLDLFISGYHGYIKDDNGEYGFLENPNSFFDWYVVGGRWNNLLITSTLWV